MADNTLTQLDYQATTTTVTDGNLSAALIRGRWEASQRATMAERRAFWLNSAFVGGEQWVSWDVSNNRLVEVPPDGDRIQLTENRLWPSLRTLTAKLLKRAMVFEVAPSTADDAAVTGARTSASVLVDVHSRHDWEGLRHSGALLALKGGISVLCVEWDPTAGIELETDESGKKVGTGDTVESVLSVCEVGTEPGARNLEKCRWWIKATAMPPKDAQVMFGLPAEPQADASAGLSPLQRTLVDGGGLGGATDVPLTLVLTYFERPNPDNKAGAVAVVVGSSMVKSGKWSFPFTEKLNCIGIRETPHDNDWLADTILSAAVSPQMALNHAVSKIGEHMRHAADARLGVPEGAGDEWDELSDLPEVVRYYGATPPAWIGAAQMPEWWITAPDRAKRAIDDILGVHDISRGEGPTGVTAGIALAQLAEQDDTPLGLLAKEMAEGWGRFATLVLEILAAKVTEKRTATVSRAGQAPETTKWSGADLAGQTTATVPLAAVMPRSDAAQTELAFRIKATFPELGWDTFNKIANLPDADHLAEAVDMDVAKAERENAEMVATGEPVLPAAFDDHAVHIKVHNDFRKTSRYEALAGASVEDATQIPALMADPSAIGPKTIIDIHIIGHEVTAARAAGVQLAKAAVSPALAAAPQANEPPMAGEPGALEQMRTAQNSQLLGGPAGPGAAPGGAPGGAPPAEGADGQAAAGGAPPAGGQ